MSCYQQKHFTNLFDLFSLLATYSTLNLYLQPLPANILEQNTSKINYKNASVYEKLKLFVLLKAFCYEKLKALFMKSRKLNRVLLAAG